MVGLTLMFVKSSTVPAIDIVSSIVYAAVLPYAAIVQTLLYYDARARRAAGWRPRRRRDGRPGHLAPRASRRLPCAGSDPVSGRIGV